MTSATLTTRSMAFKSHSRTPLLQQFLESLAAANTRRAGIELHRQAMLRADSDPIKAKQLVAAARFIEIA